MIAVSEVLPCCALTSSGTACVRAYPAVVTMRTGAYGRILGAFEKERFTRRRHDTGEVESLIRPGLRYLGLVPEDIDFLATSEPVAMGQTPGHTVIAGRRYERLNDWQWQVARCLDRVIPCLSVPHHVAHAAYARYTSPFAQTAVLTMDGGGDACTVDAKASTTVSSWRGSKLEWIERN
jgi:carbamoyltransferase